VYEACAVEQDVGRADFLGQHADRELIEHVELAGLDALLGRKRRELRLVDIGRPDRGAFAREGPRRGRADALPRRRDEARLALQSHCSALYWTRPFSL